MTEQEFRKTGFRSHEEIIYSNERLENMDGGNGVYIKCMLLSVDFEGQLLLLVPFPGEHYSEKSEFWAPCKHCNRPAKKARGLKIVKRHGT